MSLGSMLKQNLHLTLIMRETMPPVTGAFVSVFNSTMNSLNSLAFICAQTSASANGEHFPQTPLIVGSTMYVLGLGLELLSETHRHIFKKDERNRGKVYSGGLFGASRHVNYFGYMLWRSGYALAAGGWAWGAVVGGFFAWDFLARGIPVLQEYLEEKVSACFLSPLWFTFSGPLFLLPSFEVLALAVVPAWRVKGAFPRSCVAFRVNRLILPDTDCTGCAILVGHGGYKLA